MFHFRFGRTVFELIQMLDLKNVRVAVVISFPSHLEAGI